MIMKGGVREAEVVQFLPCTAVLIYRSTRPSAGLIVSAQSGFCDRRTCSMPRRQTNGQSASMQ